MLTTQHPGEQELRSCPRSPRSLRTDATTLGGRSRGGHVAELGLHLARTRCQISLLPVA